MASSRSRCPSTRRQTGSNCGRAHRVEMGRCSCTRGDRTAAPVVTSETTGGPILLAKRPQRTIEPLAVRVRRAVAPQTRTRQLAAGLPQNTNCAITQDHSISGETPSSITFDNESGVTVAIYWLDYGGSRVLYNLWSRVGRRAMPSRRGSPIRGSQSTIPTPASGTRSRTRPTRRTSSRRRSSSTRLTTPTTGRATQRIAACAMRSTSPTRAPGPDTITFAIGAAGSSQTILPTSTLPAVTDRS